MEILKRGRMEMAADLQDKITAFINEHENDMIAELSALCSIDSVRTEAVPGAPFGPGPKKALDAATEIYRKYGFPVTDYENKVRTADFGGEEPGLDIIAHVDVVPAGEGWIVTGPFCPVLRDGRLYGRGTADDKCGVIVTVYAMRALKELGVKLSKRCRLITGSAEETGMEDVEAYYKKEKPAPMTITPDADYPVINIEKGRIGAFYDAQFPASDGEKKLIFLDGGIAVNQVPATARGVVAGIPADKVREEAEKITRKTGVTFVVKTAEEEECLSAGLPGGTCVSVLARGRAAHASTPHLGRNSVLALSELILALGLDDCPGLRTLDTFMKHHPFGEFDGTHAGIAAKDEVSGATTLSADIIRMTQTAFHAETDARTAVCADEMDYQGILDRIAGEMNASVAIEGYPSHIVPGDSDFVKTLNRAYEDVTGLKGGCVAIGGSSYVHHVEGGVAFGCLPEGDEANIHGPNESMSVDWLKKTAVIYAMVMAGLCG